MYHMNGLSFMLRCIINIIKCMYMHTHLYVRMYVHMQTDLRKPVLSTQNIPIQIMVSTSYILYNYAIQNLKVPLKV